MTPPPVAGQPSLPFPREEHLSRQARLRAKLREGGFEHGAGTLALAVTAHPDFDDTPLYDENRDGQRGNDGNLWHSHWVVLKPTEACGKDALAVVDIPEGTKPRLPKTWPGLPILLATGYADLPTRADFELPRLHKPYHQAQLAEQIQGMLG